MLKTNYYISLFLLLMNCNVKNNKSKNEMTIIDLKGQEKNIILIDTNEQKKHRFIWTSAGVSFAYYLNKSDLSKRKEKNILYYYKTLPPFIFGYHEGSFIHIDKYQDKIIPSSFYDKIIYQNVKNGYLKVLNNFNKELNPIEIGFYKGLNINLLVINYFNKSIFPIILKFQASYEYLDKADTWIEIPTNQVFSDIDSINSLSKVYFKLPEQGTTILACQDSSETLKNPDEFWQDKLQNHSKDIIKIDWDAQKGKFFIKK